MPGDQDVKIAILEEQLKAIRDQQKTHAETTEKMFTKLFVEIDILKAALNRGKGVLTASLTFAGALGVAIGSGIEYIAWVKK